MRLATLLLLVAFAGCDGLVIQTPPQVVPAPQPVPNSVPVPPPQPERLQVYAFTATWCGACLLAKPSLEKWKRQGILITEIDADAQPQLVQKYRISTLPTFVVIDSQGNERQRTTNVHLIPSLVN